MESFLNRYRNITVLLLVIFAQLVLLAVQVRNDQDVRMIRVWTVTAVTPLARIIEWGRGGSIGFVRDYILLHDTHQENRRLQAQVDQLKIENNFLKNELNTAERGKELAVFQEHTPSKTLAANVIGSGAGTNAKVVFVDRGSAAGVRRGMAVVTPDGIVGTIIEAYPTASEVLLITDPDFAAGVITQKTTVRGTLKGQGTPLCKVDYVPFEEKVQVGDWVYTSGDDRVFPRGFPVGQIKSVQPAQPFQEILVDPSGMHRGLEDVLILLEGVHQTIPDVQTAKQPIYLAPPLTGSETPVGAQAASGGTAADQLRTHYLAIGEAEKHTFGEGPPGTKPPDFNIKLPAAPAGSGKPATAAAGAPGSTPVAPGATTPAPKRVSTPAATPSAPTASTAPAKRPSTPAPPGGAKSAPPSAPASKPAASNPAAVSAQPGTPPPAAPDTSSADRPRTE